MALRFIPKGPRGITESRTGRVRWKPGDPHPLDHLTDELTALHARLPTVLASVFLSAQHTQQQITTIPHLEQPVHRLNTSVHMPHLLGHLHAIQAAMNLANGLFAENDALTTLPLSTTATDRARSCSPPDTHPVPAMDAGHALSVEQQRLLHLDEPLAPLVRSVEQSRQLLRDFEASLLTLHAGLARRHAGDPQLLDKPDDQRTDLSPQLHAARASLLPAAQQTQAHLSLLHHLEQGHLAV